MNDPRISVIVPHLNQPAFLARCLASLTAQTYGATNFEIIVVDNGSKELPVDICAATANVLLDKEPMPGPGPARNKGVALSGGGILAFIDADCLADENWLSVIAREFATNEETMIIGGDVRIAKADPERLTMLEAYESIYAYRQQNYIEKQGFSGTGNLSMRRSVHDEVGPFSGIDVAEDREWGQRATALGYRIRYVPGMIVFHPARKTFTELFAKWDRHVAHDFAEKVDGKSGMLRWLGLVVAIAGSPVLELGRIVSSRRVKTVRERVLAAIAMCLARWYRSIRMAEVVLNRRKRARSDLWNRE